MSMRTMLVLGSCAPIVFAAVTVIGLWLSMPVESLTTEMIARLSGFGAAVGAGAVLLAAWMYRFGKRGATQIERLVEQATADKSASMVRRVRADDLTLVSEALQNVKEVARKSEEMARKNEEMTRAYAQMEAATKKAEQVTDTLRANEIRVADCLERLQRAERAVTLQSREAVLGNLFAGVCRDFSERLQALLVSNDNARAASRMVETAHELQSRMRLYARLAANRVHRPESFPLLDLLNETALATEPRWKGEAMANGAVLQVRVSCPPDIQIRADRLDLMEILIHLLDNAVAAMPLGGTITLEASRSQSGHEVLLAVRDQGPGMSDEVRRTCCEAFVSTREDSPGLGLKLVTELARQNGIRFGLSSARGQGTTALLEIPALRIAPMELQQPLPRGAQKPMLILAIDDQPLTAEILADMLQQDGHVVDICTDPRKSLQRFGERPYDLVITDRAMPGISGLEIAKAVRAQRPEIPVIMLTGFADSMRAEGFHPEAVDLLLGKPFTKSEIGTALKQVSRIAAQRARSPQPA
jgi:signal transduction histidine kinase/ActR/RegA family two-component response regulator